MIRRLRFQGSAHARVADPVALRSGLTEGQAGFTKSSSVATLTGFVAQTEFSSEWSTVWGHAHTGNPALRLTANFIQHGDDPPNRAE